MRYHLIRKMDIANGPGVRVSVFFQGCSFHCKGCFNEETWDFSGGKEFDDSHIIEIMDLLAPSYISGLSILGGEPFHPLNIQGTIKLAKCFKEKYPEKNLWIWTGYLFDDICDKEILKYADVIVDGPFDISKANPMLQFKGSSNQRLIDVAQTSKFHKIVLYEAK